MSVSGRMPSLFSPGDCFRSQKVEFAGIKLGVLIYPKGTDRGSEGVTQIYIKNYSEKARIFDVSVSLGDKDKRYTHLPLNKRRCKMIGEFAGPEKADGHSPLLIAEVALTTKRNKDESSELRDEMRQLGNEIKETIEDTSAASFTEHIINKQEMDNGGEIEDPLGDAPIVKTVL